MTHFRHSTHSESQNQTLPLLAKLWRGGSVAGYWTPNGGADGTRKRSHFVDVAALKPPPVSWQTRNTLFFVNPIVQRRQYYERSTIDTVECINSLFFECDAKDTVRKEEWEPFYQAPDVSELSPAQARGALAKAQTDAIEAACAANLAEYKRRALAHVQSLTPRPSACWDSGGGYQCVWLLKDPLPIDESNRKLACQWQHDWVALMGGDPGASQLSQVLRLPGSTNYKSKYAPNFPQVTFLWCDLDCEYPLDELVALLPAEPTVSKPKAQRIHIPPQVNLPEIDGVPEIPTTPAVCAFNRETNLRVQLLDLGYSESPTGRLSRPGATTGGVEVHPDNSATIYSSADPLYCGRRVRPVDVFCVYEHGGKVEKTLAALDARYAELLARLDAYRTWLASPDAIDALKEAVGRNAEKGRKLLDCLWQRCEEEGTNRITPGYSYLVSESTISRAQIGKYLERLQSAGFLQIYPGENGTKAAIEIQFCTSGTVVHKDCRTVPLAQNWNTYRALRPDEYFMNGHACYTATHPQATLKAIGDNGLPVLVALLDGSKTTQEVVACTGHSYHAVARVLRRAVEHGLVTVTTGYRNVKTYSLKDDWRDILEENRVKTPTYGIQTFRRVAALRSRVQWLRAHGQDAKADKLEPLYERMVALEKNIKAEAGIVPYQRPQPIRKRKKKPLQAEHPEDRRRRLAQAAELAPLAVAVSQLKRQGVPRRLWDGYLSFAGFAAREITIALEAAA